MGSKKWVVPKFELKDTDGDGDSGAPVAPVPPGVEFVPTYDGQNWSLCAISELCPVVTENKLKEQQEQEIAAEVWALDTDLKDATQRFLDGLYSDESDDGAEFGFEYQ